MKLTWDEVGKRLYETGVDRGVLYPFSENKYQNGVAWNGLTAVNEKPSGAEPTDLYANNAKYASLLSTEELGLTIEAYTYPEEFELCDGSAELSKGVTIGQQDRASFGLAYRTLIGNDTTGTAHGYKLHLVYGCKASPAEKNRSSVNESPDVSPFSWEVNTTPVAVDGHKPTAMLTIDSTKIKPENLKKIEDKLYGDGSSEPTLPLPSEVLTLVSEG